ncbi:MAG: hypothetical protein ACX937_10430 [Roseicyclus sp.]
MHETLAEILQPYRASLRLRPGLLRSEFGQTTTLSDLLSDPEEVLAQLRLVPGVGEVSIARIKQAIFGHFAQCSPVEWSASDRPAPFGETADGADPALLERFRHLRQVWGFSRESLSVAGVFHPDYTSRATTVFPAALSENTPFVYAPESLPEILKTPAVFKAEQGWSPQRAEYLGRLKAALDEDVVPPEGSLILLDRYPLEDLAKGRGQYAGLGQAEITEQLAVLKRVLCAAEAPVTVVTEFRKVGMSSGFATANGPLFHYCFGGYIELRGHEVVEHFHSRAQAAAAAGIPLADWFG